METTGTGTSAESALTAASDEAHYSRNSLKPDSAALDEHAVDTSVIPTTGLLHSMYSSTIYSAQGLQRLLQAVRGVAFWDVAQTGL